MAGDLTLLFLKEYQKTRQQEADLLKKMLTNKQIHHKVEDVVSDYRDIWSIKMNAIENQKTDKDGNTLKSLFRERLFEKFRAYLPYDFYEEGKRFDFEIERILDRPLQQVKDNFLYNYETADGTTRYRRFFDYEEVISLKEEDLTKMLAQYHALYRFNNEFFTKAQTLEIEIKDEKRLVSENKFNDLTPKEVYDFFIQLVERIPKESKPMLTRDQVIRLTNMICNDTDEKDKIDANIKGRKGQLTYFVYKFYLHSRNSNNGTEESNLKYISILTRYIAQFKRLKPNNFANKPKNFDIKLLDKYKF